MVNKEVTLVADKLKRVCHIFCWASQTILQQDLPVNNHWISACEGSHLLVSKSMHILAGIVTTEHLWVSHQVLSKASYCAELMTPPQMMWQLSAGLGSSCLCNYVATYRYLHCKNKLVVLTAEWLPWLQTNWRDSAYESFTLVWKTDCIRIYPRYSCPAHLTTTIHRQLSEHLWMSH